MGRQSNKTNLSAHKDGSNQKTRARRQNKADWDRHKETICNLYGDHDLETVIKTMEAGHDFIANKRQYVYKLGQWDMKKYKMGKKDANGNDNGPGNSPGNRAEDVQAQARLYPLVPVARGVAGVDHDPGLERLAFEADFCYGVSDDDHAFSLFRELLPKLQNFQRDVQRYLIISSARAAETQEHADEIIGRIQELVGAIAGQPDDMSKFNVALYHILQGYVYDRSSMDRNEQEKASIDEQATRLVHTGMNQLLDKDQKLQMVSNEHSILDMVAYMLLDYGAGRHGKTQPIEDSTKFKYDILGDFVDRIGLRAKVKQGKSQPTILTDCIGWCIKALDSPYDASSRHLKDLLNMSCDGSFWQWKVDLFVYCYLWLKWYEGYRRGKIPSWSQNSMVQLGLSFSDLLVTVVWMFMHPEQNPSRSHSKHGRQGSQQPSEHGRIEDGRETKTEQGDQKMKVNRTADIKSDRNRSQSVTGFSSASDPTPPEKILQIAVQRAATIQTNKPTDLWAHALDEFTWLNSHADLPDQEKQFNREVFVITRRFIKDILSREMEAESDTADDDNDDDEGSTLDEDGIDEDGDIRLD